MDTSNWLLWPIGQFSVHILLYLNRKKNRQECLCVCFFFYFWKPEKYRRFCLAVNDYGNSLLLYFFFKYISPEIFGSPCDLILLYFFSFEYILIEDIKHFLIDECVSIIHSNCNLIWNVLSAIVWFSAHFTFNLGTQWIWTGHN